MIAALKNGLLACGIITSACITAAGVLYLGIVFKQVFMTLVGG